MQYPALTHHGSLAGAALAAALLVPAPLVAHAHGRPAAASQTVMTVHLRTSGGYRSSGTLSHAEDATDMIPAKFSCVRFTHPTFAPAGKPLGYTVSFNNPGVMSGGQGFYFGLYYNPTSRQPRHVDGVSDSTELFVAPAQYKSFVPGGGGTYKITVTLAPDLHSGTFTATNLRNAVGVEKGVNVVGSWRRPKVFVRAT